MKNLHLTWQDIEITSDSLAYELRNQRFDGIVTVTKGGMIPAALLAKKLKIDYIDTVGLQSYSSDKKQTGTRLIKPFTNDISKNWLVVDDLVDSGESFKFLRMNILSNATYAVLYAKPNGLSFTDYYSEKIDQEIWISFPWE